MCIRDRLTTVAWQLAEGGPTTYAYEGAVFVMGAAVQWLRDGLGVITSSEEVEALARSAGREVFELRVDGGAAGNDLLLQLQADQLQVPVVRPVVTETTALGAAFLAGLAEGVWASTEDVAEAWGQERTFRPEISPGSAAGPHQTWLRAVERSRSWAGRR